LTLYQFYRSKEWEAFRKVVINERTSSDGFLYDEVTGKPILRAYDVILHHKIELTEENYKDANISLNPDNIMVVSHKTHNIIHNKLGYSQRQVFIVYGSPLSGKSSYVAEAMSEGDLIIDLDSIWQAVSGCDRYVKPNRLKSVVFSVRDNLIESVKFRRGKWLNAYVIGGYPFKAERERLASMLGAREIYIDTSKEECIQRLAESEDGRDKTEWLRYTEDWWLEFNGGY
jgi:predicted kinase